MHRRIHHRRLTNRRRLHGLPALWQRCCFAVEEYAEELQFRLTPKPRNRRRKTGFFLCPWHRRTATPALCIPLS